MASQQELFTQVDTFNNSFLVPEDPALDAALKNSKSSGLPEIAVSAAQGKFLHLIARSINAKRILEIGTLGGYSAIWLAKSLPEGGELVTLELSPEHAKVAQQNITNAGYGSKVNIKVGPALETLQAIETQPDNPFDFVFIDADYTDQVTYVQHAKRLLRPGGVIIIDNVVRRGQVADLSNKHEWNEGIRALFAAIQVDKELDATIINTVGIKKFDGFLYAVRK